MSETEIDDAEIDDADSDADSDTSGTGSSPAPTPTPPTPVAPSAPAPAAPTPVAAEPDAATLEAEGEIAADYLEELLDIADIDGDIDIDIENDRAAVEIVAEEGADRSLRRLVGDEGEVLDALQELTRLAVQAKTGDRSRLMLDVAGHRAARKAALTALAEEAIAQVRVTGSDVSLEAMNPFERKVVHDAVAAAGLVSDSEGAEPNRRVVVRSGS